MRRQTIASALLTYLLRVLAMSVNSCGAMKAECDISEGNVGRKYGDSEMAMEVRLGGGVCVT